MTLAPKLPGIRGCLFKATPASIFDQVTSYAAAHLFYDFILVAHLDECIALHTDGPHAKRSMEKALSAIRQTGVGMDPWPLFDEGDLNKFADNKAAAEQLLELQRLSELRNQATRNLDEFFNQLPDKGQSIPTERQHQYFAAARENNLSIERYEDYLVKVLFQSEGFKIDDGRLTSDFWDGRNNDAHRAVLKAGQIPLSPPPQQISASMRGGEKFRALSLAIKSVPLPRKMEPAEFAKFRTSKAVRSSLGSFRRLAEDLVQGQPPSQNIGRFSRFAEDLICGQTRHVSDEIAARYQDYAHEISHLGVETVQVDVNFVVSNMGGLGNLVPDLAESIIRGRIDDLENTPFELTEFFVDEMYRDERFTASPFHFLITASQSH